MLFAWTINALWFGDARARLNWDLESTGRLADEIKSG